MFHRFVAVILLATYVNGQSPAPKPQRLALVIANGDYSRFPHLTSSAMEAQLIQSALEMAHFEVQPAPNLHSIAEMRQSIARFLALAHEGDILLIYYSGYAVQYGSENFLLPVDFKPPVAATEGALPGAYSLGLLRQDLEPKKPALMIFVLETGRPIGFFPGMNQPGLMEPNNVPAGSIFAFSMPLGKNKAPDNGAAGLFTTTLAEKIGEPGLRIREVFDETRSKVESESGDRPYLSDSIASNFFFTFPALTVSPPSLSFAGTRDLVPGAQQLTVYSSGYGARFSVSVPASAPWLTAVSRSSSTPSSRIPDSNVTVSVDPANLSAGTYHSAVTISSIDGDLSSSPQLVPISFTVSAKEPSQKSGPGIGVPHSNKKDREEYLFIPSGNFRMGCVPGDGLCKEDETPQHTVILTKDFWMGRNEVRTGSYSHYVGNPKKMPTATLLNKGWKTDELPIVNVTWEQAAAYCRWAGGRLPTEAEWEYAARGGTEDQISPISGEDPRDKANFYGRKNNDLYEELAPVAKFDANFFGLYDMAGNVWEWVSDFYSPRYDSGPVANPLGPVAGKFHVMRGGSFNSDAAKHLRTSLREGHAGAGNGIGFRCVLDDTPGTRRQLNVELLDASQTAR